MSFILDPTVLAVVALEQVSEHLKTHLTDVYDDAGQKVHDGYSRAIHDLDSIIYRTKVSALGGRVNRNHAQASLVHLDYAANLPGDDPKIEVYLLRSYIHAMHLNADAMIRLAESNEKLAPLLESANDEVPPSFDTGVIPGYVPLHSDRPTLDPED